MDILLCSKLYFIINMIVIGIINSIILLVICQTPSWLSRVDEEIQINFSCLSLDGRDGTWPGLIRSQIN